MDKKEKKKIESQAGRQGQAYGSRFRALCKGYFLQVRSIPGVQRQLKQDGYKHAPNKKTLENWRKQERWDDELRKLDMVHEPTLDPTLDPLEALYKEVSAMRKVAREKVVKIEDGKLAIDKTSSSQDIHAYNRLAETEAKILAAKEQAARARAQETPVEVIFSALMDHPKIGLHLKKPEVMKELKVLISEKMLEHTKASIGL